MHAWWRANNYLTVGQIYLMDSPLLRQPLVSDHIKPRILGHWGTSPGLSFIYTHSSRLIRHTRQELLYLAGPGHGGPALVTREWSSMTVCTNAWPIFGLLYLLLRGLPGVAARFFLSWARPTNRQPQPSGMLPSFLTSTCSIAPGWSCS